MCHRHFLFIEGGNQTNENTNSLRIYARLRHVLFSKLVSSTNHLTVLVLKRRTETVLQAVVQI